MMVGRGSLETKRADDDFSPSLGVVGLVLLAFVFLLLLLGLSS